MPLLLTAERAFSMLPLAETIDIAHLDRQMVEFRGELQRLAMKEPPDLTISIDEYFDWSVRFEWTRRLFDVSDHEPVDEGQLKITTYLLFWETTSWLQSLPGQACTEGSE